MINNSIRGKILCLLFATFAFLSASISRADHVEPEVKTQVNKQTDLFEKSIQDLPNFTKKLEEVKQDGIESLGEKGGTPEGLKFITEKSKAELEAEGGKLGAIHENDLAERGRQEMIESNNLNELYPNYNRSLTKIHMEDAETIAKKHDEFMDTILGELKDKLGVDCKTIKGDKRIEPEYFLQIKKTQTTDTVYNQTFCEELRNKYSCNDTVTLKCQRKGMKWNPWENREIKMLFQEIPGHWWIMGRYTSPTYHGRRGHGVDMNSRTVNTAYNREIAAHITNKINASPEQVQVGNQDIVLTSLPSHSRNVELSPASKTFFGFYSPKDSLSTFTYQFRTGEEICEEWSEDWNETCRLQ